MGWAHDPLPHKTWQLIRVDWAGGRNTYDEQDHAKIAQTYASGEPSYGRWRVHRSRESRDDEQSADDILEAVRPCEETFRREM